MDRLAFALALIAGVVPLWITHYLPFVDQPQHLHLISVLSRLGDSSTVYPALFQARDTITPYVGYYAIVSALSRLVGLEAANKMFLSAYVVAMPLSMAFLLRSVGRPVWPSLLSLPFAYGDNLAWGFINFCAALPLAYVSCGLCVRAMTGGRGRRLMAVGLAASLMAVLLFHVMAFAFVAVALPLLLCATRAPGESWLRARRFALAGVVPAGAVCAGWLALRLGQPSQVVYGAPWQAWGPVFSNQNLLYKPFAQNLAELPRVLANMLRDGSDRYGFYAVCACAIVGLAAGLTPDRLDEERGAAVERWRIAALATLALALFFVTPFDIRGYVYYVNTRYAQLAAPLVLASMPAVRPQAARALTIAAALAATLSSVSLARGFAQFDRESKTLDAMVAVTAQKPMVMGLIFDPRSRVVTHPVYLHSGSVLATARGGATNFSFALTPHSPVEYKVTPPPTFPSEWRPEQFDYATQGAAYDHFLVRGVQPRQVFGRLLDTELYVAAQADGFSLVRRRNVGPYFSREFNAPHSLSASDPKPCAGAASSRAAYSRTSSPCAEPSGTSATPIRFLSRSMVRISSGGHAGAGGRVRGGGDAHHPSERDARPGDRSLAGATPASTPSSSARSRAARNSSRARRSTTRE